LPVRIIDTRLVGGPIGAGTTRNVAVSGAAGFAAQGGMPPPGIPLGAPAAVINDVAVGSAGPGDIRVTGFGTPVPLASIINNAKYNYANYATVSGLNIANRVGTQLSTGGAPSITVQADVSATDLMASGAATAKSAARPAPVKALGQCFETALRVADQFLNASDTCRTAGGRLAAGMELRALRGDIPPHARRRQGRVDGYLRLFRRRRPFCRPLPILASSRIS
jgi:hypothetical protein